MSNPLILLPFLEENKSFDFRDYTPIAKDIAATGLASNTWKNVYTANGEGFISLATCPLQSNDYTGIRITVDGTIVYRNWSTNSSGGSLGVIDQSLISAYFNSALASGPIRAFPTPLGMQLIWWSAKGKELPSLNATDFTNDTTMSFGLLPFPLKFKTSISVDVGNGNGGSMSSIAIMGGIK
jgi:hypothetical protein